MERHSRQAGEKWRRQRRRTKAPVSGRSCSHDASRKGDFVTPRVVDQLLNILHIVCASRHPSVCFLPGSENLLRVRIVERFLGQIQEINNAKVSSTQDGDRQKSQVLAGVKAIVRVPPTENIRERRPEVLRKPGKGRQFIYSINNIC